MFRPTPEDTRAIGFNDQVQHGPRSFHVQTEVMGTSVLKVRTIVVEAGVVRLTETVTCPTELPDLSALRAAIAARHREVVEKVSRGAIE